MAPPEKELEPIKDRKIVERYLRYALEFRALIRCIPEPGAVGFEAVMASLDAANLQFELKINPDFYQQSSWEELAELDRLPKELRLSFQVNDVLFFLHARFLGRNADLIGAGVDLPIYKLQRRNAVRIKILEEHRASVELAGKTYIPHDVSASGLSIVIGLDAETQFPVGKEFRGCRLRFQNLNTLVDLAVANLGPLHKQKEQLWKVGFKFVKLPSKVEQELAREAYLHTHKIWSRWL